MNKTLIGIITPLVICFFSSASAEEIHFMRDPIQIGDALNHSNISIKGVLIREDTSQIDENLKEKNKIIRYTQSYTLGNFDRNGFAQMSNQLTEVTKDSPYFVTDSGQKVREVHRDSGLVSIFNDGSINYAYSYGTQSCHLSIDKVTLYCNGISKFTLNGRTYEVASNSVGQVSNVTKK